jgi:hypothetical protein
MIPRSGGEKVYLEAAYKRPKLLATVVFAFQIILLGFTASACIVFTEYVSMSQSPLPILGFFTICCHPAMLSPSTYDKLTRCSRCSTQQTTQQVSGKSEAWLYSSLRLFAVCIQSCQMLEYEE